MQVILPMSDYVRLVHEHANASRLLRECCAAVRAADAERDRFKAALEMLAQTRHVTGSAQGVFRSHLLLVDAVLAGADVRDLETVEAIVAGTWKSTRESRP